MGDSIKISNKNIKQVALNKYLRYEISIGRDSQTKEIERRISLAWAAYGKSRTVFQSSLSRCFKRKISNQCFLCEELFQFATVQNFHFTEFTITSQIGDRFWEYKITVTFSITLRTLHTRHINEDVELNKKN